MSIRTAIVPVAGFGTRFLPATKTVPKAMLPVFDTPPLHLAVQEAVQAGVQHVVIVVSPNQEAVGDYFTRSTDLERALEQQGKLSLLQSVRDIAEMARITIVTQDRQLGLGHAVLLARDAVGDEPFAVCLPDDVIWDEAPTIGRMAEVFREHNGAVIAVKEVPDQMVPSLGIVEPEPVGDRVYRVLSVVEKPALRDAPSNMAIIGRYVLPPEIFDILGSTRPGAIGEIQLTDAISTMLSTRSVYAYRFPGEHFDVGTPLGLLKASVFAALREDRVAGDLREWMAGLA